MLLLRQFTPLKFARYTQRFYAIKPSSTKMKRTVDGAGSIKQVHKEQLRFVDRNAKITIYSEINMKISAADVHQYPDGNALLAELYGGPVKNCTADMKVNVAENDRDVEIVCKKLSDDSDFHCVLAVPIQADLNIETKDSVSVHGIYSQVIKVQAQKNIVTKDIKCKEIWLNSAEGDITCNGMLLAETTTIQTKGNGSVYLDKPQGALLECKTEAGGIKTASCYADSSKFSTDNGVLDLKNVHKNTQVIVYKTGDINMSGFNGNLYMRSNGGNINLQLSEICGENIIMADKVPQAIVNISDTIEEKSYIEITAEEITLDDPLSHLSDGLTEKHAIFRMSTEPENDDKLIICTKGKVKLGKLSWADSMKQAMGLNEK